jgi:hypothetical protein
LIRTLVIGVSLPDASFDNHSFTSAPSIADYSRLIIDIDSASRSVEEVVSGAAEHRTFAGQPVANQPSSSRSFALSDLLAMRTREARRFFERGGSAVCFAHSDVPINGIADSPEFKRYGWLPEPAGFSYRNSLLPCFGKEPVTLVEEQHPFAGYIHEFGRRLAYRVSADEATLAAAGGHALARSAGDEIVAFHLPLLAGSLLFLPPVADYADHRREIADVLLQGFESAASQTPAGVPEWMRKETP